MLAKVWKKVLLAICIIACIYNVMTKLVNRHSLEDNLKKANNGEMVYNLSTGEAKTENQTESLENEIANSVVENTVVEESDTNNSTSYFTFKFLH